MELMLPPLFVLLEIAFALPPDPAGPPAPFLVPPSPPVAIAVGLKEFTFSVRDSDDDAAPPPPANPASEPPPSPPRAACVMFTELAVEALASITLSKLAAAPAPPFPEPLVTAPPGPLVAVACRFITTWPGVVATPRSRLTLPVPPGEALLFEPKAVIPPPTPPLASAVRFKNVPVDVTSSEARPVAAGPAVKPPAFPPAVAREVTVAKVGPLLLIVRFETALPGVPLTPVEAVPPLPPVAV